MIVIIFIQAKGSIFQFYRPFSVTCKIWYYARDPTYMYDFDIIFDPVYFLLIFLYNYIPYVTIRVLYS